MMRLLQLLAVSVMLSSCEKRVRDHLSEERSARCPCGTAQWSQVSLTDGGCSLLMPSLVQRSCTTNQTAIGGIIRTAFSAEPMPGFMFDFCQSRLPADAVIDDPSKSLDAAVHGAIGNRGKLVSTRKIALRNFPGIEGYAECTGGEAVTCRLYLVGHDLYQLSCQMPKTQMCQEHLLKFLDSFDLEAAAQPGIAREPGRAANPVPPQR
jgi:hypothetical protein